MGNRSGDLHLSPSELHNALLAKTVPSLAYDQGEVRKWQARLGRKLRQLVGEIPKERVPLNPRRLWRREHPLGSIEKVVLTSEPYADMLAYVCLPKSASPPYTFMICLQGHSTGMHNSIGVMGDSGGGSISVFSAALLPRIAFAMPACYFCTFRDSIMAIRHCTDNYVPNLIRYAEMADVMGLFAPKPVVLVAGRDDEIFPIRATRRAFRDLKQIYRACGAEDRCHLVVGKGGHRFYADDAWPVMLDQLH